nr:hypothetical protein [uncultured Rhodopila sp.]
MLAAEQVVPDAPFQIKASDLMTERVATAIRRKTVPCRAEAQTDFQCFQLLEEEEQNERLITGGFMPRSAALIDTSRRPLVIQRLSPFQRAGA